MHLDLREPTRLPAPRRSGCPSDAERENPSPAQGRRAGGLGRRRRRRLGFRPAMSVRPVTGTGTASVGRSWRVAGGSAGVRPNAPALQPALLVAAVDGEPRRGGRLARGARESRPLSARRSPPIRSAVDRAARPSAKGQRHSRASFVTLGAPADTAARTLTHRSGGSPHAFGRSGVRAERCGRQDGLDHVDRLSGHRLVRTSRDAAASPFDDGIPPPSGRAVTDTLRARSAHAAGATPSAPLDVVTYFACPSRALRIHKPLALENRIFEMVMRNSWRKRLSTSPMESSLRHRDTAPAVLIPCLPHTRRPPFVCLINATFWTPPPVIFSPTRQVIRRPTSRRA